jgi:predicted amidohydrolase
MRFLGGSLLADIDGKAIAAAGAGDALIIGEISQARRLAAAKCFPYRADRRPELYAQLTSNFDGQC